VSDISTFASMPAPAISPLNTQADKVLRHPELATTENSKIEKSAKDFESILLGSWLQQAEQSFASLPGGDDDGDADAGKEQFQGIAMRSLGDAMTAAGGIGIAKMIAKHLHKAADGQAPATAGTLPAHPK
jgi:Rod binding domain-containing protein